MSTTKIKCISWSAVSSRPQVEGESLADQSAKNQTLIDSINGQTVADLIVPGESREILDLATAADKITAYPKLRTLITRRPRYATMI